MKAVSGSCWLSTLSKISGRQKASANALKAQLPSPKEWPPSKAFFLDRVRAIPSVQGIRLNNVFNLALRFRILFAHPIQSFMIRGIIIE